MKTKHKHKAKSDSTSKLLEVGEGAAVLGVLAPTAISYGAALAHA